MSRERTVIRGVGVERPVDALRSSSEQMRRAAALLSEIAEETEHLGLAVERVEPAADPDAIRVEETIRVAQRSFAATLRLAQLEEDPDTL